MTKRVVVGLSGGVDSSAAIIKLQEMGYEVVGVTFRFIDDYDSTDAIDVANKLGIEHYVIDYRKEFKTEVVDKFLNDYKSGLTPNPCVHCNRYCKFNYLFECMKKYNCDYVATGHYANIRDGKIYKSFDLDKDQSYFLYNLPKNMMGNILFPLEGLTKEEVRSIALKAGLDNYSKKDSFDVCFINTDFRDYISNNIRQRIGDVINIQTGEKVGKHKGLAFYTIGQRKGLDIGGTKDRMFVVGKDVEKNILYICLGEDSSYLESDSCIIGDVNLLTDDIINECNAKFRYRMSDVPVELEYLDNGEIIVKYDGVKRVTPGQACVLYKDDQCLGGGIIKEVRKNNKKLWYI